MSKRVKKISAAMSLSILLFNNFLQPVAAIEQLREEPSIEEGVLQTEEEFEEDGPPIADEQQEVEPTEDSKEPEKERGEVEEHAESSEDESIADVRNTTGTWGTVAWTWVPGTRTITLRSGNAGTANSAPWKTHTGVVRIVVEGRVVLPADSARLFRSLESLERIDNAGNFDTSRVTTMFDMFWNTHRLTTLDVSNWNTSNVRNMESVFNATQSLTSIDVSNWNTANVTNMSSMFRNTRSLRILDISNWDTRNVTNMYAMFWDSSSLTSLDVSNWNTRNVINMAYMFQGANSLTTLDVSKWDTRNVTNMVHMFLGTNSLTTLDVLNWDTRNVTDMFHMFRGSSSLTSLDVSNWDTRNVTNMTGMFMDTHSLTTLDVSKWDTRNVTDMSHMFRGSSSLTSLDVSNWDTRNVTNMTGMFMGTSSLTLLDVSGWDTRRTTVANGMFSDAINLSTLHLGANSRFDHLASPPNMPGLISSNNYTGNWVYYLNQAGAIPDTYHTVSSSAFWREYNGTNPGTYTWQTNGSVAVYYRDTNEQEIADPQILTGGIRAPFQIDEKVIDGYTLHETPKNISGRFDKEQTLVIFRYMKDTVDPVDPLNPEEQIEPENKPSLPEGQGLLSIDFVSTFQFGTQTISAQDKVYHAQPQRLLNENGTVNGQEERPNYVQISDRRSQSERNGWQLAVRQNEQFKGLQGQELTGAQLRLTNQQLVTAHGGKEPSLLATNPLALVPGNKRTLIRAEENEGVGTWIYRFGDGESAGESIVLEVPQGASPEMTTYKTTLTWELSAVPGNN